MKHANEVDSVNEWMNEKSLRISLFGWVPGTVFDSSYSTFYSFCDENLPSFAVSTLGVRRKHSPNAERFIFPLLFRVFEPKKKTLISVGHLACAERKAGVWHDASWNDLPLDVWSVNESGWRPFSFQFWVLTGFAWLDFLICERKFCSVRNSTLLKR